MKVYDGIMGFVVGDAIGLPYEFKERDSFKLELFVGHRTHNQPSGTWSFDSSLILATMDALIQNDCRFDLKLCTDIMTNFIRFYQHGAYTQYDEYFDIDNVTKTAFFATYTRENEAACNNSALARILPIAYLSPDDAAVDLIAELTHKNDISTYACEVYVRLARRLLEGYSPIQAYYDVIRDIEQNRLHTPRPDAFKQTCTLYTLSRNSVKSSDYAVDTLEAAMWSFITTDNYKDCITTAVELGDDTNTIAALAGGLAGIAYGIEGEKGIPQEWINSVPKHEEVQRLCARYERAIPRKVKQVNRKPIIPVAVREWIYTALIVGIFIAAGWAVKANVCDITRVDGVSMEPTLMDDDRVVCTKLDFIPQRGDIVMLDSTYKAREEYIKAWQSSGDNVVYADDMVLPNDLKPKYFVKRVIATAGQTVDIHNGKVYVNGRRIDEPYYHGITFKTDASVQYPVTVDEGCVFVMGDNRGNSNDSRNSKLGMVPCDAIIGKIQYRLYPFRDAGSVY